MSYYDRKYIKGSCESSKVKDDYKGCSKDDHKHDDYKHEFEEECCEPCAGVVTASSVLTIAVSTAPTPVPLTTTVLTTDCIDIPVTGGITVEEDGEYLISFTAGVAAIAVGGALAVYADSEFLGNVGPLLAGTLGKFAEIRRLKAGTTITVVATGVITLSLLDPGTLTVAKVGD